MTRVMLGVGVLFVSLASLLPKVFCVVHVLLFGVFRVSKIVGGNFSLFFSLALKFSCFVIRVVNTHTDAPQIE